MPAAAKPANEAQRLQALRSFHVLDTPAEKAFDDLVRLASYICETPIAAVSFVDEDRQWFKARVGMNLPQTKRDVAFCAHAILMPNDTLVVPDATLDARFSDNPFVVDEPKIRFYAGAPLVAEDGFVLGTLCVIDHKPKELSAGQVKALSVIRNQVVRELELVRKNRELAAASQDLEKTRQQLAECETRCRKLLADSQPQA